MHAGEPPPRCAIERWEREKKEGRREIALLVTCGSHILKGMKFSQFAGAHIPYTL
jgi:hypothetical protein